MPLHRLLAEEQDKILNLQRRRGAQTSMQDVYGGPGAEAAQRKPKKKVVM